MKKYFRNILILLFPFIMMVSINELVRPTIYDKPFTVDGISAMNSSDIHADRCSWICHNQTNYCKEHHVKLNHSLFPYTDPLYFGTISMLRSTGNYSFANVLFLLVLIPLFMWVLLVKSLNIQNRINQIKRCQ